MIWGFIQNQMLGMKWLNELIGKILTVVGLDVNSRLGGSIQFFIYDVLKITVLLCFLIYVISYIQSYFPPERSKKIMGKFKGVSANCIAALLGTVTPFCSCSSIPLFIGFTSAGLPLGVTFSFLISSPMVDLGSLILLMSIFGTKVAVVYVVFGLVIAVVGGTFIEKMHLENYVEDFIRNASAVDIDSPTLTQKERLEHAKDQVVSTFKKVFPYILVGVGIGALIHNWIPEEVQKMVTKVASQSMVGDMGRYQQMAMIDAMTNTSNNGGGNNMATDMASMQMGMMMGQQMVNQMQSAMQQNNQNMQGQVQNAAPAPQNQAAGQASGTIPNFCPNCGQKTEGSKFCPNCGQKLV